MKKYKQIDFVCGEDIESAVKILKSQKHLSCGEFNGQMLYSDIDNVDSAFKKITGKTKSEFYDHLQKENERYEKELREHIESIPKLTEHWINEGKRVLDEKYYKDWAECVPIRLDDIYRGMELRCTLEIVEKLNKGCDLDEALSIINNQGHSGMSFGLVCSMVKHFSDRGGDFSDYAK